MNMFRGWIATTFLMVSLFLSATPTRAGVIYGGLADDQPVCSDAAEDTTTADDLGGIIYGGLTGVIYGFTGIIFGGTAIDNNPPQECGIIYGG